MHVFVTGASGFLGRAVVARLVERGHEVCALIRPPASRAISLPWVHRVQIVEGDLLDGPSVVLPEGVETVVHLAAAMAEDAKTQLDVAEQGTRNLVDAIGRSPCRRVVHVSSMSVYDMGAPGDVLDESWPLESERLLERDGYAIAKCRQEAILRDSSARLRLRLSVLRPGFIWGPGRERTPAVVADIGILRCIVATRMSPAVTYVENCADALVTAVENPAADGGTFNITDDMSVSSTEFAKALGHMQRRRMVHIPVSYAAGLAASRATYALARLIGCSSRLPGILRPMRFRARFRPVRYDSSRFGAVTGWYAPFAFEASVMHARSQAELGGEARTCGAASPAGGA